MKRYNKKHILRNVLLSLLAFVLVGGLGLGLSRYREVKSAVNGSFDPVEIAGSRDTNALLKAKKPISVLLMGTDTSDFTRSYAGKTDTMMVLTIDPKTEKTTITSIPHDLAVKIPGYDKSPAQISAAYEHGQAKSSITTVQKLLNVPVDYYALINISGMEKVIDKIGGVDITPSNSFTSDGYSFEQGVKTHMDGAKALAYSQETSSSSTGYLAHESRQGTVMAAIMHRCTSIRALMNPSFLKTLSDEVQTNMTFDNMTTIIKNYKHFTEKVDDTHIAATTKTIDGQTFEVVSQKELQRVSDFIRGGLELKSEKTGNIQY
ncbi:LCP family protein [Companilactobacillus nodensis]|uniref:Transcriptional regulator n=1 Tax=Companilactobacillus nodensis DSM 19682 = JCM 14932 = NBRC 107160 TaxID=1423775 RepID=A0A0R1K609_9LACO|nr:LCP family protein [Companilactobacillus nodensis]KRK79046.1 transcriptional regulator [Companilactobacillus nodensis DSM 19682 = JCM 14932 = NBRC 107160]